MTTKELQEIITWAKSTDLVDIGFKEGAKGFSFSTTRPQPPVPAFPQARLVPVTSPGIGIFQWNEIGRSRAVPDGETVESGGLLGVLEEGGKKATPITSPCAGRLAKSCIEAGQPVQFGQPLFFIEPR